MGSPRKLLAIVSTGACLVAFTALGSANPADKAQKQDSGCRCCSGADGACRTDSNGQPAPGAILLARSSPNSTPEAEFQKKAKEQSKASPATLAKGVATRKALLDQVSGLVDDGVADCCIDPGCGFCPITADGCGCAGSLAKGGPVCPECWGGWQAGQGMLPDIKPETVKILPKETLKTLYGMRAEKLEQAGKK